MASLRGRLITWLLAFPVSFFGIFVGFLSMSLANSLTCSRFSADPVDMLGSAWFLVSIPTLIPVAVLLFFFIAWNLRRSFALALYFALGYAYPFAFAEIVATQIH